MKIRIWDLPTRLFHWLLVLAVIGSFVSVKLGGNAMIWHGRFGYLVLTLIVFRLIWGFVGTHHARFAQFIKSPKIILAYLKNPTETPGHSPLGAISVIILITLFDKEVVLKKKITIDHFMLMHSHNNHHPASTLCNAPPSAYPLPLPPHVDCPIAHLLLLACQHQQCENAIAPPTRQH